MLLFSPPILSMVPFFNNVGKCCHYIVAKYAPNLFSHKTCSEHKWKHQTRIQTTQERYLLKRSKFHEFFMFTQIVKYKNILAFIIVAFVRAWATLYIFNIQYYIHANTQTYNENNKTFYNQFNVCLTFVTSFAYIKYNRFP